MFIEVNDFHHGGRKLISVDDILYVEQQKNGSATIQLRESPEGRYFHVNDYLYVMRELLCK